MHKTVGRIGWALLLFMTAVALLAPLLAPYDPYASVAETLLPPSRQHWHGTNDIGQDIFSELLYGTRTSLAVGACSAAISMFLGTAVGMVAGWFGGTADRLLMKITVFFMTIPYLPAVIILSAFAKPSPWTTSVILGVMSWSGTARVVRSETMAIRQKEYIRTIAAMGASDWYLLRRHVFRELLPLLFYRAAARVKAGILSESSLSFLGLGSTVQKSWGTMLYYAQAKNALLTDAWLWWVLPPGLCIALLSCALVMISYSAEGRLDQRLEVRHA